MIHALFERQAEQTPDAVAIVFEDSKLTYCELDQRANLLADRLRALGVGPDVLVALFLGRSLDMITAMLGVLKAGGAYVPLDPTHPQKRLAYMLADAQPLVLLTQEHLQSKLPPHGSQVVVIDAAPASAVRSERNPVRASSPGDLAYVIYTSGSTGQPKGVEIEHRSVLNMLASMQRRPGLGAEDTLLAITTLSFDIAVLEIFLPLVCGARVVVAPSHVTGDGAALAGLIKQCGASILQATPSTLRILLDAGWDGDPGLKILCGGEAWNTELAELLLARCGSLWNMYGPTETTVWSAVVRVEADQPVVIGPPIANTSLYVVDNALQLVPVGVPGELCIGGAGLARGYLHRPELTHDRFVSDPFKPQADARMYRTGDLVRRLPKGALEFLGRLDHQVKIAGNRIELGEIEAALERHPDVKQCVVVASDSRRGDRRLIAYVVPAAGTAVRADELRSLLSESMPAYMIPSFFISLASFPLTANGKLDRKALPPPDQTTDEADIIPLAPRTPAEEALARLWCEMLERNKVGVRDNFFELGGNSLLAARLIGRVNKTFETRLAVAELFLKPTVEALAAAVERSQRPENTSRYVVPIKTGHIGVPVYFVGAGPVEHRIAKFMSGDRAIFGVDLPIDPDTRQTIQNLGALYGKALHMHARSMPCVIAGYSFKGKIAFETARALQDAGGNVAFVLLIDAFAWYGAIRGAAKQSWKLIWRRASGRADNGVDYLRNLGVSIGNSYRLLRWLLARMPLAAKGRTSSGNPAAGMIDHHGNSFEQNAGIKLYRVLSSSFQPRALDASGLLIRAEFPGEATLPCRDLTNGWTDLFLRGLEIIEATGDHLSIVADEGNAQALSRQIDSALNRYDSINKVVVSRLG